MRKQAQRPQGGFSLVEILVTISIVALLGGTLLAAFVVILRGSAGVEDRLGRANAAQRVGAAWTKDAQSVDVDGVNSGRRCDDPSGTPDPDEVDLVHFTFNSSDSAPGSERTASWVVVGRGEAMDLVRRECGAGTTVEVVLAKNIGDGDQLATEVVHGPDASSPSDFCPTSNVGTAAAPVLVSDSCTIVVEGSLNYSLTVTRRVSDISGLHSAMLVPAPPEQVTVASRNGYLSVAWYPVVLLPGQPAVSSYQVFVYDSVSGEAIQTVTVDGYSTTAVIPNLTNYTDYWVRVRAANSVGYGEFSSTVGPTEPRPTPPEAPTIVNAYPTSNDGEVFVSWTPPGNDGGEPITGWTVIAEDPALQRTTFGVDAQPSSPIPAGVNSFTLTGLTNGTTYRILVRAHNTVTSAVNPTGAGDESQPSEPVVPFGLPPAGTGVESQGSDAAALVRWTPAPDGNGREIVGYRILTYRSVDATEETTNLVDPNGQEFSLASLGCTTTCMTQVPLSNDGAYYRFAVITQTEVAPGELAESEPSALSTGSQLDSSGLTMPKQPPFVRPSTSPQTPGAPSVVDIGAGSSSGRRVRVTATLGAGGGEPVERVQIISRSRSSASGSSFGSWSVVATANGTYANGQVVPLDVDNLASGRVHEFAVRVANRADWASGTYRNSPDSAAASLTLIGSPGAPTAVSLVRPTNSFGRILQLSWGAPTDSGGGTVSYSYSCTATGETAVTGTSSVAGTVTMSALRDGKTWSCTVTATNSAGSATSSSGTALPYGECTLTPTENLHIRQSDSGTQFRNEELAIRSRNNNSNGNEIWVMMQFNLTATTCAQAAGQRIPVGAYIQDAQLNLYRMSKSGHPTGNKTGYLSAFPRVFDSHTMDPTGSNAITWSNSPGHGAATGSSVLVSTFNIIPAQGQWFQIGAGAKVRELFTVSGQHQYWWSLIPERNGNSSQYADYCSTRSTCATNGRQPNMRITFYTQGPV